MVSFIFASIISIKFCPIIWDGACRQVDLGRCLNELPRIQIGECEIKYTCGTSSRQVVCLFHDIPCVRTGGRHLVLFRFHYWNKGISCVQPFVGFGIRCSKGIWRALKKLMSTDFSYMVISGCARASRATAAPFPRFCEIPVWLNYRLLASLSKYTSPNVFHRNS